LLRSPNGCLAPCRHFWYGKQAALQIEGRETLIDKVILEQLYDPMTHLVNNSITHGMKPEERSAQNKSPVGQITIRAFFQGAMLSLLPMMELELTWNG